MKEKRLVEKNSIIRYLDNLLLSLFSKLSVIADYPIIKYLATILFLIPIFVYFFCVIYFSKNVPFLDDYDSILKFLVNFKMEPSYFKRVQLIFAEHNDHHLAFLHLVALAQYYIFGTINFVHLIVFGNLSIAGILYILWISVKSWKYKLYYFLPTVYLLFGFAYYEASLWAMVTLSGLAVVVFAFAAIYLIEKDKNIYFIGSSFFAILAVFTQGNGKIALICCLAVLIFKKKYKKSIVWIIMSILLVMLPKLVFESSFRGYNSIADILKSPSRNVLSIFSFLGTYFESLNYSIYAGVFIIFYFIYLILIKYYNKNLTLFSMLAFIVLNSLAVGYARPSIMFPSRYAIYSILAIVLLHLTSSELRINGISKIIIAFAAGLFFVDSLIQYSTISYKLKYYNITVKNYEAHLVSEHYSTKNLNREKCNQELNLELSNISFDPLVKFFPKLQVNKFVINSKGNTKKIMNENFWWFEHLVPFSKNLKASDSLKIYRANNILSSHF
jgi:hypothetical protein